MNISKITDIKTVQRIVELINGSRNNLVLSHQNPDGDTLGSMIAFGKILSGLGHDVDFVVSDPVPEVYKFLPYSEKVKQPESSSLKGKYDVAFSFDCGSVKRLGRAQGLWGNAETKVNIDHHISNEKFGTVNWIEADATSTGQMVYWLAREMKVNITPEIATLLYTTLLTDTMCFSNSNTNAEALKWAGELVERGADHLSVYRKVFLEKPLKMMKIFAVGINNIELIENGEIAWTYVRKADMDRFGATSEDTEDIVDYVMRVKGVKIGIFFREDNGETKVSLRSNTSFDVSKVAASFGGGGHKRAAGINVKKSFEETKIILIQRVIDEYRKEKK